LQEVLRRTYVLLKLSSLRSLLPEGACGRTGYARLPAGAAGLTHQLSLLGYQSVVFGLQHRICFKLHPDIGRDKGLEIASQLLLGPVRVVLEALYLLSYSGAACRHLNLLSELLLQLGVKVRVFVKSGHAGERPEYPLDISFSAVRDYRDGCNPAPASPNSCLTLLFDLRLSRVERTSPLGDSSLIRLGLFERWASAYSTANCRLATAPASHQLVEAVKVSFGSRSALSIRATNTLGEKAFSQDSPSRGSRLGGYMFLLGRTAPFSRTDSTFLSRFVSSCIGSEPTGSIEPSLLDLLLSILLGSKVRVALVLNENTAPPTSYHSSSHDRLLLVSGAFEFGAHRHSQYHSHQRCAEALFVQNAFGVADDSCNKARSSNDVGFVSLQFFSYDVHVILLLQVRTSRQFP
jgi:hypothetical protein